uniref:protein-tyrosine-phosphatase n=1 Tax=Crassostrea virginica TaxID=6565 RepID=A0A8B8BYS3_CRAVI|nr:receptor-type tyrosine-protein phosphatase gamma-like isoform X3 [Crassostrea virginica]
MSAVCFYLGVLSVVLAYDNIALNKQAHQDFPYSGFDSHIIDASNAVDGLKSNLGWKGEECVLSEVAQRTATWWVNLTSILSIHHITIYYRTENAPWGINNGMTPRFLGFSLYVSNTTERMNGTVCFKDESFTLSTIPAIFNTTCPVHGQYVIYYNERLSGVVYPVNYSKYAFNELCEVEVYGCPKPGYYGSNCSTPCTDVNCRYCHIETGACQGCKPGFRGHRCELECSFGFYGQKCEQKCDERCTGCNNVNGLCDRGCQRGWKGNHCQEHCGYKTYGTNCSEVCGQCFQNDTCHHINGSCMNGCDRGYKGLVCTEPCSYGYYGYDCKHECNSTCTGCDAVYGLCNTGCKLGWRGVYCQEACNNGTFGHNCSELCGSCVKFGQCHHINGTCLEGCISGFMGSTCTQRFVHVEESSDYTGPAVGATVGVLVVSSVVIVVAIIIRMNRRKSSNQSKYKASQEETIVENQYSNVDLSTTPAGIRTEKEKRTSSLLRASIEKEKITTNSHDIIDDDNVYMNETISSGIPLEKLDTTVLKQGTKEYNDFKKEYAVLPSGEIHRCEVGKEPENIPKNRFKTTFPYDHSRVVLRVKDEESSDYINANYINGTNRPKEYIAAQGPKQNTVDDFWKMIWQEDVSSIVMLTNLKEGDKVKCVKYWPSRNDLLSFGSISVKLIEEKIYAFFIERKLSVTNSIIKKTRTVIQFHYISWPDHGTPEPISLLDFYHHVTRTTTSNEVPTLVHCSAGVGRTGTYIALDALYREGRNTGAVNVVEFVKKMRNNRVSMVQTYEQYITIYLALNEIFKAPIRMCSSTDFCSKIEKTMKDTPANRNPLRKEFQLLMKVIPTYTEKDYKIAKESSKNKPTDRVLPLDKYSLHLSSMVPKRGSYINAIYVPSFIKAKRFIVTHYPTPEDAVDFLRLLNDHESDTVICMDPIRQVESIQSWLPDLSCSKVVSPFTIHCQSNSRNGTGQVIDILQNNQEDEVHSVLVEGPRNRINPSGTSRDTSELLQLITTVLFLKTENPITVVSSDGASLCGVFIAVHNAIQQLNTDSAVDVFTVVRQLQIRRPELCNSIEEYEMVQRAVYDHIQTSTENIYSNQ